MPGWMVAMFAAAYAGAFASFAAVLVDRLPRGVSLRGESVCACGRRVPWRLNVPVVGWLVLRGRAACCGALLPRWAWLVEVSSVAVAVVVAPWSVPAAAALVGCGLVCFVCVGVAVRVRDLRPSPTSANVASTREAR